MGEPEIWCDPFVDRNVSEEEEKKKKRRTGVAIQK
jgi:hypothetical protein